MAEKRKPPTGTVRVAFIAAHPYPLTTEIDERAAEFDRWLAKVKADALREAASDFREASRAGIEPALNRLAGKILDQRADRIEKEADRG